MLLAVVLLGACTPARSADDDAEIQLRVEPESAAPGDSLVLILENGSPEQIGYNLCTSALERQRGSAWEPQPSDRICTMELRTLAPGSSVRYPIELPQLAAGEYRAVTGIERMQAGDRIGVASEPFRVAP